jgi:nicotinate-nucleotide--dimethylbenzimidazole phosphoribosyltransferase
MSAVVTHLIESIQAVSGAMAAARSARGPIAAWLAGARHSLAPSLTRRTVVCVCADHGVVASGVRFGAAHPTVIAATAIVDGSAAVTRAAAAVGARMVVIDAGVAEPDAMPADVVRVAHGSSGDLAVGAAMTPLEVVAAIESGAAIATALFEAGLDLLALGAVGAGADLATAAVIAALTNADTDLAPPDGRALVAAGLAWLPPNPSPLDVLATVGGRDLAVLTGIILASAAMYVPILVDGAVTLAAALVATRLAPDCAGYVGCAHSGGGAAAAAARSAIGVHPLLSVGLGHGEGSGAAMMLPVVIAANAAD